MFRLCTYIDAFPKCQIHIFYNAWDVVSKIVLGFYKYIYKKHLKLVDNPFR